MPGVALWGASKMKMRNHFAIPVALVCILLAHGAGPPSSRIGPEDAHRKFFLKLSICKQTHG